MACLICPAEATHRFTNDLDIKGIPVCEEHGRKVLVMLILTRDRAMVAEWAAKEREKNFPKEKTK